MRIVFALLIAFSFVSTAHADSVQSGAEIARLDFEDSSNIFRIFVRSARITSYAEGQLNEIYDSCGGDQSPIYTRLKVVQNGIRFSVTNPGGGVLRGTGKASGFKVTRNRILSPTVSVNEVMTAGRIRNKKSHFKLTFNFSDVDGSTCRQVYDGVLSLK